MKGWYNHLAKKKICIIFGGQSPEHEISRKSVTSVINNLDKTKYDISIIGITQNGEWFLYTGDSKNISGGEWEADTANKHHAIISPDAAQKAVLVFRESGMETIHPDVVFPVLHGEYGEDGTIQGLLELSHIPYVGMGVLASANAMDKIYSKMVFAQVKIPQAKWVVFRRGDDTETKIKEIELKIGYPCFVKPACTGSSVGVGKAHNRDELKQAIAHAAHYDRKVLIEENIDGHEVECAVIGNSRPEAAEVGEIRPTVEFYDFDAKYNDNSTELQIPAVLPEDTRELIREYSVRAFKALDGQGLSRVDFFVKYSDGSVILNEINTMPGFTDISMYPKLWNVCGLEYGALLDKLISLAESRVK